MGNNDMMTGEQLAFVKDRMDMLQRLYESYAKRKRITPHIRERMQETQAKIGAYRLMVERHIEAMNQVLKSEERSQPFDQSAPRVSVIDSIPAKPKQRKLF